MVRFAFAKPNLLSNSGEICCKMFSPYLYRYCFICRSLKRKYTITPRLQLSFFLVQKKIYKASPKKMACTRLEWSYKILLLKYVHAFVLAIYIQWSYSAQLTHTISFTPCTKLPKKNSLRNLEITTYIIRYSPQICLRQMYPLPKENRLP